MAGGTGCSRARGGARRQLETLAPTYRERARLSAAPELRAGACSAAALLLRFSRHGDSRRLTLQAQVARWFWRWPRKSAPRKLRCARRRRAKPGPQRAQPRTAFATRLPSGSAPRGCLQRGHVNAAGWRRIWPQIAARRRGRRATSSSIFGRAAQRLRQGALSGSVALQGRGGAFCAGSGLMRARSGAHARSSCCSTDAQPAPQDAVAARYLTVGQPSPDLEAGAAYGVSHQEHRILCRVKPGDDVASYDATRLRTSSSSAPTPRAATPSACRTSSSCATAGPSR